MYIEELFIYNKDGNYESVGWGVFNSEGRLIAGFPTKEEAEEFLEESKPSSPRP